MSLISKNLDEDHAKHCKKSENLNHLAHTTKAHSTAVFAMVKKISVDLGTSKWKSLFRGWCDKSGYLFILFESLIF